MQKTSVVVATALAILLVVAAYAFNSWYRGNASSDIKLSKPDLRPPPSPVTTYISCESQSSPSSPRAVGTESDVHLEIAPVCAPEELFYFALPLSPEEFARVVVPPKVEFEIERDGAIAKLSLLQSSGSKNVDAKAIQLIRSRRYKLRMCGKCKVQTMVSLDVERNER